LAEQLSEEYQRRRGGSNENAPASDLSACLVVVRPDDGEVLVVIGGSLSRGQAREPGALILHRDERQQVRRALARQ
jgi:hypothetical protein